MTGVGRLRGVFLALLAAAPGLFAAGHESQAAAPAGAEGAVRVSARVLAFPPSSPSSIALGHHAFVPGVASTAPAPTDPDLARLGLSLAAAVAAHPEAGRVAVAVTDLQSGETVSVNGDRLQYAGCTTNMFALLLAMRDVHDGRYPLEAVADLVRTTIRYSNPTTARELYRIAGSGDVIEGVRRAAAEIGPLLAVAGLNIDHPPAYISESIGGGQSNLATAEALNQLMLALYRGNLVEEPERGFLLEAMDGVYPGLNYLLGVLYGYDGVSVHHKNGFFEWVDGSVDNDTGIVLLTAADGTPRAFAMTLLAEAVPQKFSDVPLGQQLARLAYEHFAAAR